MYLLNHAFFLNFNYIDNNKNKSLDSTNDSDDNNDDDDKIEARKSLLMLAAIFSASLGAMFYVYLMFPNLDE